MSEADRVLVRRHFEEIWNRRDFAVADELMAENHLEHAVAPYRGDRRRGEHGGDAAARLIQPPGRPPA